MNVFTESQVDRDSELSAYSKKSMAEVQKIPVGDKRSIQIYANEDIARDSYSNLYKSYPFMESSTPYLRTLAAYTVTRRAKDVLDLEKYLGSFSKKKVLDYGCGVGSHGIYCLQRGATVDFLDVNGPLFDYAKWRIKNRKLKGCSFLEETAKLEKKYDAVICMDVLEHVANPVKAFSAITASLRSGGLLLLEVSTMVKPTSGHFSKSIALWKKSGVKLLSEKFVRVHGKVYKRK